uniref:Putative chain length factor n=1 Tax=Streptomyces toxytricini TaxID=67369 RepID=Q0MRN4_STRT5|nr:putative chain length factor [Streptomyces toxytricini]
MRRPQRARPEGLVGRRPARRERHPPADPLRRLPLPGAARGRGARVRRRGPRPEPAPPADRPGHPPVARRRQGSPRRRRRRPRRPARLRGRRRHRQLRRRVLVPAARAGGAVEPRRPARQRVPVLRLVLRSQQQARSPSGTGCAAPAASSSPSRPAGWTTTAHARRQIIKGAHLVVTGGIDSSLCPWGWAAHLAGGGLSTEPDPARAYLPFDPDASGYVVGEGGAHLVLEDAARARERGARIYGVVAGHGAAFDGPAGGAGGGCRLGAAAGAALADAGIGPGDVDVVFADAAGERTADRLEAEALAELFGPRAVPVTAPKSMTGRLAAGGSALDLAAALMALHEQVVPPTTGTSAPADDCPVDLVTGTPRTGLRLRTALVLARGRGGFNSAVVVRAPAA